MSKRIALMAAAGTLALGVASAQTTDKEGFYGALGVGAAFEGEHNDFESDGNAVPTDFDTAMDTATGPSVYVALGKYFPRDLRGEVEIAYRNQNVTDLPGDGGFWQGFPTGGNGLELGRELAVNPGDFNDLGDVSVTTAMVNAYKDFNFDATGRFTPYLGVGVGFAKIRSEFDNVDDTPAATTPADAGTTGYRIFIEDDDYVTAFQGLAGVSFALTDNLSIDAGYRYLQTGEYDMEAYINNVPADVSGEYRVHEAKLGLRWDFGARAAAAPVRSQPSQPETKTCFDGTVVAADAPCPTPEEDRLTPADLQTVVYFDFDKADLTSAARSLLQRRAQEASTVDVMEIVVSGNTDTAGTNQYNERLSARRAQVVRDALVGYGVDASKIRIRALGETNLAKPTADGVREPLNRRTEVEFDF